MHPVPTWIGSMYVDTAVIDIGELAPQVWARRMSLYFTLLLASHEKIVILPSYLQGSDRCPDRIRLEKTELKGVFPSEYTHMYYLFWQMFVRWTVWCRKVFVWLILSVRRIKRKGTGWLLIWVRLSKRRWILSIHILHGFLKPVWNTYI